MIGVMKQAKWLLILLSALLYSIPFVIPTYSYWGIFFFLMPLFFVLFKQSFLTFFEGLIWGLITFFINYFGLLYFFIEEGKTSFKWFAWCFLWFYIAAYAGIWFWLSSQLIVYFSIQFNHALIKLFAFASTTIIYFYWLSTSLLWIFGLREGTLFSFPLLPLMVQPHWLFLLPYTNKYLLLLILVLAQGCCSLFLARDNKKYLILSFLLMIPFLYGWLQPISIMKRPVWLSKIGFLKPNHLNDIYDCAEDLMLQIQSISQNPTIEIIIGPESTFPYPLNTDNQCFSLLAENGLESRHLLIGAHHKVQQKLYNSLYWINESRIIHHYDKKHLTPFAESLPNIWNKIGITKNLFLHKKEPFCGGLKNATLVNLNFIIFYPMICSELFFLEQPPPFDRNVVILLLVNDHWFSAPYLKQLMALVARFKAIEWNRQILYVSHDRRLFFSDFLHYTCESEND
jgi:apolipoprotein N-acyltransferase